MHLRKITLDNPNTHYVLNLGVGLYSFEVYDGDSIIQKTDFEVEKPFFTQTWFILTSLFCLLGILSLFIYFIVLYRLRQQNRLLSLRSTIASDLHDDVGATLSSLSFFGEMIKSKLGQDHPKEEIQVLLDKLIHTSKDTIETMRGVVYTLSPNNENAEDFFRKMHSFAKEMLALKHIEVSFVQESIDQKLPLNIQRNVFLFFKEVVNNIAKHSKAIEVTISIKMSDNKIISIEVSDNGCGFEREEKSEGHGLKSLEIRAKELEGELKITSKLGEGTITKLSFPFN